jgi:hypothetical protein
MSTDSGFDDSQRKKAEIDALSSRLTTGIKAALTSESAIDFGYKSVFPDWSHFKPHHRYSILHTSNDADLIALEYSYDEGRDGSKGDPNQRSEINPGDHSQSQIDPHPQLFIHLFDKQEGRYYNVPWIYGDYSVAPHGYDDYPVGEEVPIIFNHGGSPTSGKNREHSLLGITAVKEPLNLPDIYDLNYKGAYVSPRFKSAPPDALTLLQLLNRVADGLTGSIVPDDDSRQRLIELYANFGTYSPIPSLLAVRNADNGLLQLQPAIRKMVKEAVSFNP